MSEEEPLPGIAALADRAVDPRRVAIVMGIVAIAIAIGCVAMVEHLLSTANEETRASRMLRELPRPPRATGPFGRAAVVIVDGMRVDEAGRMRAWTRLRARSIEGELALPLPTLSRPFYHHLLTGVPPDGSGVRSNRFARRARHDAVTDRVRAAGGRVFIVADGLPWMRILFGRPGDGGSDAPGSIDSPLDGFLREWSAAEAPALLIVHAVRTDGTAHEGGIHSEAHRRALAHAERVIERVAAVEGASLFVLSDHGHLERGGHGGPEREVARSPLLIRAPRLGPLPPGPYDPSRLAATISAAMGVSAPRSAVGSPLSAANAMEASRRAIVRYSRAHEAAQLAARRQWTIFLAFFAALMTLGPIKRAFGFDRSVPVAMIAWPALLIGIHLALGRPLSLSAIDGIGTHSARVAAIGLASAIAAFALARSLGRGEQRTRRAAAVVGWIAWVSSLACTTWIGFALGPWTLGPRETYVPLLTLGAAAPALAAMGIVLLVTARR